MAFQFSSGLMAKTDIEGAFRVIPINSLYYHLLGFKVIEWKLLFGKCSPMDGSSSCKNFKQFSSALQWVMQFKYRAGGMYHILDDFLLVHFVNKMESKSRKK